MSTHPATTSTTIAKPHRKRPRAPKAATPPLTAEQVEKVEALAKLGPTITPTDAARILGLRAEDLAGFLASPAGAGLWERARAQGRAELAATIRRQALTGDVNAQKLMVQTIAAATDETIAPVDQRISAAELNRCLNRSPRAVFNRCKAGEIPPPGPDRKYRVGEVLAHIAVLWDRLDAAEKELRVLRRRQSKGRIELDEARRRAHAADARLKELKLAMERGRTITRHEHHRLLDQLCGAFVGIIQSAPGELAASLSGRTLAECRAILQTWANQKQYQVFEPPEGMESGPETAPAEDHDGEAKDQTVPRGKHEDEEVRA